MSVNSKLARSLRGPGPIEIILSILISLVLGVLLGCIHLIFKPVPVVKKLDPAAMVPGEVYFLEGTVNGTTGRQWTRKRQMLAEGNAVDVLLNEEELNAWMAASGPRPASALPNQKQAEGDIVAVTPDRINFRVQGGVMQVGLLSKISVLGITSDLVVQTRGVFVPGPDAFVFKPQEFYVGSLPLHVFPGLSESVIQNLMARALPDGAMDAWKRFSLVDIEDNSVRLVVP